MSDIDVEFGLVEVINRINHWQMVNAPLSMAGKMELDMIADELEHLGSISTEQLSNMTEELQELQDDFDEAMKAKTDDELRAENETLKGRVKERNAELRAVRVELGERDGDIDNLKSTINDLESDKSRLEEQIADLEKNQYSEAW